MESCWPVEMAACHSSRCIRGKGDKSVSFPGGSVVKNPPEMQETQVQSLDQENPLKKGMAYPFQYSYLENSMDSRTCGLQSMEVKRVGHD